jgi:hypothetical protein
MNYYQHLILARDRQKDFTRERERRLLVAEARPTRTPQRMFRLHTFFRFSFPRRQPQQQPCPTCPEFA